MGLYAFFLAGSNYFAPVICGFIAQYQGWQWVFYWPAVFCAVTIAFLFFFMEETNYARKCAETTTVEGILESSTTPSKQGDQEKPLPATGQPDQTECGVMYSKKTYIQKLSIIGPRQPRNNMFRRFYQTLYYLSWPVIFYAGFSYGSYLIWFNVLNATASLILGSAPYNFR